MSRRSVEDVLNDYDEDYKKMQGTINDASPAEWDQVRALDRQVGGQHYKGFKIQPIEFIMDNNLDYCVANIIKYACRHHMKGGVQDIDKIIHYAELLKELKYEDG